MKWKELPEIVPCKTTKCTELSSRDGKANYPRYNLQEKNHALFPGKSVFISLHHGSNFVLINKTTILLHKYF